MKFRKFILVGGAVAVLAILFFANFETIMGSFNSLTHSAFGAQAAEGDIRTVDDGAGCLLTQRMTGSVWVNHQRSCALTSQTVSPTQEIPRCLPGNFAIGQLLYGEAMTDFLYASVGEKVYVLTTPINVIPQELSNGQTVSWQEVDAPAGMPFQATISGDGFTTFSWPFGVYFGAYQISKPDSRAC